MYPPPEKESAPAYPYPAPQSAYPTPPPPGPRSYPPLEKRSAPAPSAYPTAPPPNTCYPSPPPPGPGGYPPHLGQQHPVVEGIPVGMTSPQPQGIQTTQEAAAQQTGYWSTGLCDCFHDTQSCCLVCWCPCVAFGRLSEIADKGTSSCGCNGSLYLGLCLLGGVAVAFGVPLSCQWIYSCTYRAKLKQDMNMPPSCCEECCIHFWCEPCALCQEYRELQNRGYDLSLGWNGNQEKRRQQAGNGMPAMVAAPVAPSMNR